MTANDDKAVVSGMTSVGDCQTFPEGCVGCCVNMHWDDSRIRGYLSRNTELAATFLPAGRPILYWRMVKFYYRRGGWLDMLLTALLVLPTAGLSALWWHRRIGSCPFAGYLDNSRKRAGCLIHPARVGLPDARRHAFPLLPLVKCNRQLRCPALDNPETNWSTELLQTSRIGQASLAVRSWRAKASEAWNDFLRSIRLLPRTDSGAVLMEYVVLLTGVVFVLITGQTLLFDIQGSINGNMGVLGEAFRQFYLNLISGISMPVP